MLTLTFLFLPRFLFPQEPSVGHSAILPTPYSQEAFVIERGYSKVKFENDGTFIREDYGRIRIQADAGVQRYGLLTFSYADSTGAMEIDYVRVRKPDGTVVVTPPENVQDMAAQISREAPFYSDLREKHVAVKGLAVGDVLEFDIHNRVTKPLVPGQFWLQYSFARDAIVLEEELEVTVPRERPLKVKSPKLEPAVRESGAYRVYNWKTAHLEAKDEKQQKQEAWKLVWEQTRGRQPAPDILLSSFQSWQDVGRWYESLQQERVKPTPEIRAKATELTKASETEEAKLRAIYTYVASQYHYIGIAFGIGRYQPHSAADVLANRYGDCKDKHTLLAALLTASGIKAYPVLISSQRELDPDVPSPGQVNHVITAVPRADGLVWLDSTTEVGPYGYLIPPLRDKRALLIPEGQAPSLINTPPDPPFASSQRFTMTAKLSDAGTLEGQAEVTVRGDLEYVLRAAFRSVPLTQWKDLAQRVSYSMGFGGEVSEVNASSPEKIDEPFRISYKYTRKDYGDWPNHRILIPSPAASLPIADEDLTPAFPLWLGSPGEISFHSELALPEGYTPETLRPKRQDCESARYDADSSFKDGKLISDRHLVILRGEVPPAAYDSYKQFRKLVADDYSAFITLYSQAAPLPANGLVLSPGLRAGGPPFDLPDSSDKEAVRLEGEAREAMGRNDIQTAVASLYRAVTDDPKFVRAWVALGGLLMASHQTDAGVDAFHKAIAADRSQPLSYKLLGTALIGNSRLEEAVSVWQDLIRLHRRMPMARFYSEKHCFD